MRVLFLYLSLAPSPDCTQVTGSLDMDDLDDSRRSTAGAAAALSDACEPARSRSQPHIRSHDGFVIFAHSPAVTVFRFCISLLNREWRISVSGEYPFAVSFHFHSPTSSSTLLSVDPCWCSAGIQRKALRLLGTFSADVRMTKALKLLGTDMQELETARNVALAALGAQRLDLADE